MYVEEKLGRKYIEKRTIPFEVSYDETGPATPMFFVLSPGVDPLKDVEAMGRKLGFTLNNGNFHNVSLGQVGANLKLNMEFEFSSTSFHQGQEIVAENALDLASKEGHWVVLQVPSFIIFKGCAILIKYTFLY